MTGASLRDRASRATHRALSGLGHPATIASAWTPGPWLVHATNRLVCQAEGAFKKVKVENGKVIGDDLPNNICLLRDPGEDFSEDETLANGFLIAAAPDGYALAEAYERLEADIILNADWSGETPRLRQDQWDRLLEIQTLRNAFFAKARGEQP